MKQKFARKTALFMCFVTFFCSLTLNVNAYETYTTAKTSGMTITDTEIRQSIEAGHIIDTGKTDEQVDKIGYERDAFSFPIEIIKRNKKVIIAVSDYLVAQENKESEQEKAEPEKDSEKGLTEAGIAGYLYDPAEKCFYTASDPWQRTVGYNEIFDVFSEVALIDFDTIRFKFDYKDKNWLIQMWKGQYGLLFYGAEVGVYNKPADRKVPHYDAVKDSERLGMSIELYEYEQSRSKEGKWVKKFSRPYDYHWWCTGFIPGNIGDKFGNLRIYARITAKDYDMLSALTESIEKEGIKYKVDGLDVLFIYK